MKNRSLIISYRNLKFSSNPEQCIVIGDDSGGVVQKERQTEELDLLEKEVGS